MHYLTKAIVTLSLFVVPFATEDYGPIPDCPFPSSTITYYPVVTDCSRYWECFGGYRYIMSCTVGLYWNPNLNTCDYPANVDCDEASRTNAPTTTTTVSTPAGWSPDPLCPYPSNEAVFYPHSDCTKYYECYQGTKYEMSCLPDLYWNDELDACDRQENVNCNSTVSVQ